jgi:hypothetical protein
MKPIEIPRNRFGPHIFDPDDLFTEVTVVVGNEWNEGEAVITFHMPQVPSIGSGFSYESNNRQFFGEVKDVYWHVDYHNGETETTAAILVQLEDQFWQKQTDQPSSADGGERSLG